jgi:hypothetical protein
MSNVTVTLPKIKKFVFYDNYFKNNLKFFLT